jgi:hypothetical protein
MVEWPKVGDLGSARSIVSPERCFVVHILSPLEIKKRSPRLAPTKPLVRWGFPSFVNKKNNRFLLIVLPVVSFCLYILSPRTISIAHKSIIVKGVQENICCSILPTNIRGIRKID